MTSKAEIIDVAKQLFKAEQALNAQSLLVLENLDKSVDRSFDEDELEDAAENFKMLFEDYIKILIQYNDSINREMALDLYVDAKTTTLKFVESNTKADPIIIFAQKMDDIFDNFTETLETRSDTTLESMSSDEEKISQGVQALRRNFEKKSENSVSQPFRERTLFGKNVTREVNKIESKEHARRYREEIKAQKQNQHDKDVGVENSIQRENSSPK